LNEQISLVSPSIEELPDAVVGVRLDGEVLFWNRAAERIFGIDRKEATGRELVALIGAPDRSAESREKLRQALASGAAAYEDVFRRIDGSRVYADLSVRVVEEAVERHAVICLRDVTEQRYRRQAEALEARFRGLLESAPDAMVIANRDRRILLVNAQTEKLFGYSRGELVGQPVETLVPPRFRDDHPSDRAASAADPRVSGTGEGGESYGLRKDGGEFPVEISLCLVETPEGVVVSSAIRDITERKRAEQKFRDLLESAPDAMVIVDAKGKIALANAQAEKLFGYAREEMIGQPVELLVPPRLHEAHQKHRTGYFADPRIRQMGAGIELYGVRKDGIEVPVEISLSPLETDEGVLVSAAIRDITDRKKAEEKFRGLLESAPDAMVIVDASGAITLVNRQTERLFGYSREELIGQPVELLVPQRLRDGHQRHRTAYSTGPRVRGMRAGMELLGVRKDGTEVPVEISLSPLETSEGVLISSAIRDITEQKRLKEELQWRNAALLEASEFVNSIFQSSTEYSIIAEDLDGNILAWNEGARRIYGYTSAEMVGKENVRVLYAPEELASGKVGSALTTALETGKFEGEFQRVRKTGELFPARLTITLRRDSEGNPIGYVLISKDISEEKALEEQLKRKNQEIEEQYRRVQQANRLKSEFLANMSHELRTPLNAIIGFSELMHDGKVGPISEEHKEYLGDILTSSRHLLQLINDVLDLSKVESGKMELHPEPVVLEKLVGEVRDILRTLASQKRITTEVAIDPSLSEVITDPGKLKQVLYNYLSNALKFTPEEGRVRIRILPETGGAWRLEVEDTGIGIRPEDIGRLFVEFQQLDASSAKKFPGTGLGLALTRRIVEAQGGRVGVDSTPGKGSVFFAVLPRRPSAVSPSGEPPPPPHVVAPRAGAPRVLVVEDNPNERNWLVRTLSEAGYAVESAPDGKQALRLCREEAFDVITLDLFLPDLSGSEVLSSIRAGGPNAHTPVVIVSVAAEKGVGAGFQVSDILSKPVRPADLLAALRRAGVPPDGSGTILVVDDDPGALKLAEKTLSGFGYRPLCFSRSNDALESAVRQPPAAIVLDLVMPELDGFEFLKRLRAAPAGRNVPVLVWTVRTLDPTERRALEAAAEAVIEKSQGTAALIAELQSYAPLKSDPRVEA
jgi:PAS domain S-box-containing protein